MTTTTFNTYRVNFTDIGTPTIELLVNGVSFATVTVSKVNTCFSDFSVMGRLGGTVYRNFKIKRLQQHNLTSGQHNHYRFDQTLGFNVPDIESGQDAVLTGLTNQIFRPSANNSPIAYLFNGVDTFAESSNTLARNTNGHVFIIEGYYEADGYIAAPWNSRGIEFRSGGGELVFYYSSANQVNLTHATNKLSVGDKFRYEVTPDEYRRRYAV